MTVKKHTLKIIGMHCTSCSMLIDGDLEDTKGVIKASTNYAKQICEVEFDERVIQVQEILKTIEKSGYKAQPH